MTGDEGLLGGVLGGEGGLLAGVTANDGLLGGLLGGDTGLLAGVTGPQGLLGGLLGQTGGAGGLLGGGGGLLGGLPGQSAASTVASVESAGQESIAVAISSLSEGGSDAASILAQPLQHNLFA